MGLGLIHSIVQCSGPICTLCLGLSFLSFFCPDASQFSAYELVIRVTILWCCAVALLPHTSPSNPDRHGFTLCAARMLANFKCFWHKCVTSCIGSYCLDNLHLFFHGTQRMAFHPPYPSPHPRYCFQDARGRMQVNSETFKRSANI